MCKTCSKLTITTPERSRRRSGVFVVDFEQVNDDAYTQRNTSGGCFLP